MTIRIVAIALGLLALAGTIILAVAGASSPHSNAMGPLAFLACIVAVVVMILLGVTLGGRNNPRRAPRPIADTLHADTLHADTLESSEVSSDPGPGELGRGAQSQ
jgi:membrane protein DedA with SNARE-associated domain